MELTGISRNNMQQLARRDMTARELIEFMEKGALYRSFPEILEMVYPSPQLSGALIKGLSGITGEDQDSVARKVRKWISGESVPQNREQLFQICFALGLGEAEANLLLARASETGIHYRNPKELVYAYCFRTGKNIREAQRLMEQMMRIFKNALSNTEYVSGLQQRTACGYTSQIRRAFSYVETDAELEAFFRTNSYSLGTIHETAYVKFIELLQYLQKPEETGETYSVEEVMEHYLRMNIPSTKKTGGFTYLQRVIKKNWPSESTLLRMKNRRQDISRKVLLLLFIVTEDFEVSRTWEEEREARSGQGGFPGDDFDDMEDLMEEDSDTRLEVRLTKINLFLDSYGMNRLDTGSAFDCLIIYALKAGQDEEGDATLSDSLRGVLDILFGSQK